MFVHHDEHIALKGKIAVPLHNSKGQRIGYAGQHLATKEWRFYFNKSIELFNFHRVYQQAQKLDTVILVEGFYSAMYLHQEGFQNVVACMGVNVSDEQMQ